MAGCFGNGGIMRKRTLLLIVITYAAAVGCVGGGPHLSINRDGGTPTELPNWPLDGVPVLTSNITLMGSGAALSQSANYKTYVAIGPMSGSRGGTGSYITVGPEMSVGQQKAGLDE